MSSRDAPYMAPLYPTYTTPLYRNAPIGVLDSGVGGLSVLRNLQAALPREDFIFLADQAHVPYGPRTSAEITRFVEGIVRFLLADVPGLPGPLAQRCKLIVIACNTATTRSIQVIRAHFPQVYFIGTEPAVKPAAEQTETACIGVIGTEATLSGTRYGHLVDKYARDVAVLARACPEFVDLVERGNYTEDDRQMICEALLPLVEAGIDQLVLACTHFPFLMAEIQACLGQRVQIIDPSPAIARRAVQVLEAAAALTDRARPGQTLYATTGAPGPFAQRVAMLLDIPQPAVHGLRWQGANLVMAAGQG